MRQQELLQKLLEGIDLSEHDMETCMHSIMDSRYTPAAVAAILALLQKKGVTAAEVLGSCQAILSMATPVNLDPHAVDTCGTGGDHTGTFNISTAASFIACGAGVPIAKHGNRSITSKCGSADVMEALGYAIDLPPASTEELFRQTGYAFLFAPLYHPAMKAVAAIRRELGIRTIFNMLGPLLNPARVQRQLLGVFDPSMMAIYAEVLTRSGCEHAMIVHGTTEDGRGLDEASVCGPTTVIELRDGDVRHFVIDAEEFGFRHWKLADLEGGDSETNAWIIRQIMDGSAPDAKIDAALFAAGLACYVSGKAGSLHDGVNLARESLRSGRAAAALGKVIETNRSLSEVGGTA